ncbi:MAG: carboxylate-amine ligase [Hyphomicrobiales bacterium]|nr:carboxylate-amine ligase [Hyphomicrobiales bacterium]
MQRQEPTFTIGIEEEYLLIDPKSRDLESDPPKALMRACEKALTRRVSSEFLRCQLEVGTPICASLAEARAELSHLRCTIADIAKGHALVPLAVSTHPFAMWTQQQRTDKERYNVLAEDMQVVARRLLICGMHVHVGIADDAMRIDLMNQLTYFLPHLLALSTSSPFWQGQPTGLKSYRLSVFQELPRTGLPESFSSFPEYQRTVEALINAGLIEDATKIWWDLRPSARFPTLEMRVTDVCPLIEDTMSVAALYLCLARMLYRLRRDNQRWRDYSRFLIMENRWRAQRYGISESLVDFGKGILVPFKDLVEELIDLTREDAEHFECVAEIEHAREIVRRGTSADRQLATFEEAVAAGAEEAEALRQVVDQLAQEYLSGCQS